MKITARYWTNNDATTQRIYLGADYVEMKHVGYVCDGWSDAIEYNATASPAAIGSLAGRLSVEPIVDQKLFERFREEQFGVGTLGKKECARRAKTPITLDVA